MYGRFLKLGWVPTLEKSLWQCIPLAEMPILCRFEDADCDHAVSGCSLLQAWVFPIALCFAIVLLAVLSIGNVGQEDSVCSISRSFILSLADKAKQSYLLPALAKATVSPHPGVRLYSEWRQC